MIDICVHAMDRGQQTAAEETFFPSIGFARVRHLFQRIGYSGAVSTLLALLCTECPR
jgi:hypothetical protein